MSRGASFLLIALAVVACQAGPISFSGQFDPSLATVQTNGGSGWFDASGAPLSVTLWGSDSDQETQIITLVTWNITAPVTNLWFLWSYQTWDLGPPIWDPAGYYLNGLYFQLTNNSGPSVQSGVTLIPSLLPGDVFGFYVDATDDCCGAARISITGVPEPASWTLIGLGGLGLLVSRRLLRRR